MVSGSEGDLLCGEGQLTSLLFHLQHLQDGDNPSLHILSSKLERPIVFLNSTLPLRESKHLLISFLKQICVTASIYFRGLKDIP